VKVNIMTVSLLKRFLNDEVGATSIEYALIAGLIALAIIASLTLISSSLQGKFTSVAAAFNL
jgi:pilus assembly protein Flp/PilA